MDYEDIEHLKKLKQVHIKRLRVLELKQAEMGLNTPAEIIIEISDILDKISDIDSRLQNLGLGVNKLELLDMVSSKALDVRKTQVEITLKGDINNWSPDIQNAAIRALAAIMEVPVNSVTFLYVSSGSILLALKVPSYSAYILRDLFRAGDPLLVIMEVNDISIKDDQGINIGSVEYIELLQRRVNGEIDNIRRRSRIIAMLSLLVFIILSLIILSGASEQLGTENVTLVMVCFLVYVLFVLISIATNNETIEGKKNEFLFYQSIINKLSDKTSTDS